MAAQQEISARRLQRRLGSVVDVLVDEVDEEGVRGRSYADAPEIDGTVHLEDAAGLVPGDVVTALVEDADEYDLWARPLAVA
jgi:ribosomal protein S12 methylthiotransferase